MSYESAPSTILVASHCCLCGRALVDAVSVEAGIGPECRRRSGYAEAQGPIDTGDVVAALGVLADDARLPNLPESAIQAWLDGDARKVANVLVHRIACDPGTEQALKYANAIDGLGFYKLAARLSDRMAKVRITEEDGELTVKTPYNPEAVDVLRRVPGRRWDREAKVNRFPSSARRPLFAALRQAFPGTVAMGPRGLFLLTAAA